MTTKKLRKILVKSSMIGALALTFAGCGIQDQKQTQDSAADNATDLRKNPTDKASLALALPDNLPSNVDMVEISLDHLDASACNGVQLMNKPTNAAESQNSSATMAATSASTDHVELNDVALPSERYRGIIEMDANGRKIYPLCPHGVSSPLRIYRKGDQIKKEPIKFTDLKAGDYLITVNLLESATGHVHSHGEGKATIQVGKEATAQISMTKVDNNTGGLVIVLDDASVPSQGIKPLPRPMPPKVCNLIAKAPVCVAPGKSAHYEVYQFQRAPNSCDYLPLPAFYTQVSDSLCKGLADGTNTLLNPIGYL